MKYCSRLLCCTFYLLTIWIPYCSGQFLGYDVSHFNSENGLPNTIKGLQNDRNGFVWIATESGLIRFDGKRFETYDHSESGTPVSRLFHVGLTHDNRIYIQTENIGCFYVTPYNTLKPIDKQELFRQGAERPLIGMAAKLHDSCVKKINTGQISDWAMPTNASGHSYMNSITCLNGFYYYLNQGNQIITADTAFTSFSQITLVRDGKTVKLPGNSDNNEVSLTRQNNLIYLRANDTLYRLQIQADKQTALLTPVLAVGKIANIASFLDLPDYGISIVGTIADGIYIFRKQFFRNVATGNETTNIFYAQVPFQQDGVLTAKGVLYPEQFKPFSANFFASAAFKTTQGTYLLNKRDKDSSCIYELNGQLQAIRKIPFRRPVYCFQQTEDGTILLSADSNFLACIEGDAVKWLPEPAGLPRPFRIATFIPSYDGKWWIGGKQGLIKVDLSNNHVDTITELKNVFVRSLYEYHGTLWIGTYGNGFYALYHNRLIAYPADKNHYLDYVHCFLPDYSGRLWLSTNHGLFLFNLNDLYIWLERKTNAPYFYYFDHRDGFLTNEFNGGCNPSGIVLGNGKFSFPSLKGLVQFPPDSIYPIPPNAAIFLDKVIADTTVLPLGLNNLALPSRTHRVRFYISSPYYGNDYNQHLEYSLDDSEWYNLNDDNVVEMDNLSNGDHVLTIRKRGGFALANVISRDILFSVRPLFYETVLFKLLVLALFITALYLLYRLRIKLLLQQKTKLEQQVAEKTKEQDALIEDLETVVAELEQSKEDLQRNIAFKETLSMIITHDLQSPLRFLSNAFEQMDVEYSYADTETQQLSREMKKTSSNIYQFVKDFGVWIKKVNMHGQTEITDVNLSRLLVQTASFFQELRQTHNNEIHADLPPSVFIRTDYQMLKIILHNIIDNANKYSRNGTIRISLFNKNGEAIIKIQDSGIGMKPAVLKDLMMRAQPETTYQLNPEATGTGLGYRFITDFCRMLHISLQLESKLNEGTIVTLSNLKLCQPTS
ncbi:sensor histidine kinase [Taibaiella soli]|uniref:Histidine kinase domain-containing protein n=1 Tax=Taibaiella soli TaxID=1649169 RepID=A0A2W2AHW3_9BACT|nr:HAMP domain-containing sensor histidine kinase [Taibaiella soli]PZF74871.1 hypothetical protein DN068_01355 [Taibaiella soli]